MVIYVNLPVGVEGSLINQGFSAYPNPTSGVLTIRMEEGAQPERLILHDLTGKIIFEKSGGFTPDGLSKLQMDSYKDGYYYVIVEDANGNKEVLPVILQR